MYVVGILRAFSGAHTGLALWLRQNIGSYVNRLSAGVFNSDPGLLNHIQIGSCDHQRGVTTEEKDKEKDTIHSTCLMMVFAKCLLILLS